IDDEDQRHERDQRGEQQHAAHDLVGAATPWADRRHRCGDRAHPTSPTVAACAATTASPPPPPACLRPRLPRTTNLRAMMFTNKVSTNSTRPAANSAELWIG